MTNAILADFPAYIVIALPKGHDITLTNDKGYARTAPITFRVKSLKRDKAGNEYLRAFTIGCDGDNAENVWAYGNGAMITSSKSSKDFCIGIELGQKIRIKGRDYTVEEDANNNIKLVA